MKNYNLRKELSTMSTILGIFHFLPWWLKIFIVLIIIGIPVSIVQKIIETINGSVGKSKISEQINTNPESALQTAIKSFDNNAFSLDEYEKQLRRIAESTGYVDAMVKLVELYSGEKYKTKKDEEQYRLWMGRAAKAGDCDSIISYYGFSGYDLSSDSYDEIIHDLDNVKVTSQGVKDVVSFLKGVVNYKRGFIEAAKQLFANILSTELAQDSKFMLFRCFIKESNISAAEKVLDYLEKDKFEIPAADYLNLYNYYVSKRDSVESNYIAEMKYVEKYASSKEADYKTTCKIGGSTYYSIAMALHDGKNGFEKDPGKAQEAYRMAANFGHIEASYNAGMSFWNGEYRNYFKASKYLLMAARKGHKQAEEVLEQYGVDGILVTPMRAEKAVYRFPDGFELTASGDTMKYLSFYHGIQNNATFLSYEFIDMYKKTFTSFNELVNGIHQMYADHVAQMIRWGIRLLMRCGIDTYDANDIINMSEDLSLLPRIPKFERALEIIDKRAEELNLKTAYAQATRGYWSGAAFGTTIKGTINAAVKASVAAGAMNIGSGILHGIGDSIVESMNNKEIADLENKVFNNPETMKEFNRAVFSACLGVGVVVRQIIETHCNIGLAALEGIIKFDGENLAGIDEKSLNAKINNNLSVENNEYAYALLIEKLRRHPLDGDVFDRIILLTLQRGEYGRHEYKDILRYAGDFFQMEGSSAELYNSLNAVEWEHFQA